MSVSKGKLHCSNVLGLLKKIRVAKNGDVFNTISTQQNKNVY